MVSLNTTAFIVIILTVSWVVVCILFWDIFIARLTVLPPIRSSCACESTGTWPSSLPVGHTQLEQYRHWRNMAKRGVYKKITRDQTRYTYDIRAVEATRRCSDVRVRLDEFYDGKRTVGGSCILVQTDNPTERQLCSYTDYFNGTYTIWCPAPPTTCAVLTIQRQCVDFLFFVKYDDPVLPLDQLVLRRSVCPWNTTTGCTTHGHANSPATWMRNGTSWTVGYVRGEPVSTLLDGNAICECLRRKFDRFVMVGSSHMRYKSDYMMTRCLGERSMDKVKRRHGSFSKGNKYFYIASYSQDFVPLWENYLQKLNLTKNSIVLFQTGAHAVAYRGINNAIGTELDIYLKALVNIKHLADKIGFKMVVLTSPPFPDHSRNDDRLFRNNYALAALSRLLQDKLPLYGLQVFDEFGVILPQQNNDTKLCGDHYLCRIPGKGVHGYVGITALRLLMTDICDD